MNPGQLAHEVKAAVEKAQSRIRGIGAVQYYEEGKPQKFETMSMDEFFEYMEEEALDIINYGTMLTIKINRAREVWDELTIKQLRHHIHQEDTGSGRV